MVDDFLDRAVTRAFAKLRRARNDPRNLPEPFRTLAVVYAAQGVIDNGGLRYFFESDWPGQPPYDLFAQAYRAIGATERASAIEQAAKNSRSRAPSVIEIGAANCWTGPSATASMRSTASRWQAAPARTSGLCSRPSPAPTSTRSGGRGGDPGAEPGPCPGGRPGAAARSRPVTHYRPLWHPVSSGRPGCGPLRPPRS